MTIDAKINTHSLTLELYLVLPTVVTWCYASDSFTGNDSDL